MKKLVLLALSLTLAGCGVFQPAPTPTLQPTPIPPTPQVILATVLVTVIPTQPPTDTPLPTETASPTLPPPTATIELETPTPESTLTFTPESGLVNVPSALLGSIFSQATFSTDTFSLRCEPKAITLDLSSADPKVKIVEFYYRIRAKNSTFVPEWSRGGTLQTDGAGHFWLEYRSLDVIPDNRKVVGWFDVQFIGYNALVQEIGRTQAIEELVTYSLDCP